MSEDTPVDPFSELAAGAVNLHEWFTALLSAGFSELQALVFMAEVVRPRPET